MTAGKLFYVFMPQFPHPEIGDNNTIFMKLNELIFIKLLVQCLAQRLCHLICQIKYKKYEREMGEDAERPVDCQAQVFAFCSADRREPI